MRRSSLPTLLALSLLLTTSACGFYFGDDDDDPCLYPAETTGADYQPLELRNPFTGECQSFGGGGWCDYECGPCPAYDEPAVADPSWGYCESQCTGLDEAACLDTPACRGAYVDVCPPYADCDVESALAFADCWAVDQTGPIQGECSGLDAWDCSRHDDCRAVHWNAGEDACTDPSCIGDFGFCMAEPAPIDPGTCWGEVWCDIVEPVCPAGSVPGVKDGCYTGQCIALSDCEPRATCSTLGENQCIDRADCDPLYEGVDCTCDASGCACREWIYDSCANG